MYLLFRGNCAPVHLFQPRTCWTPVLPLKPNSKLLLEAFFDHHYPPTPHQPPCWWPHCTVLHTHSSSHGFRSNLKVRRLESSTAHLTSNVKLAWWMSELKVLGGKKSHGSTWMSPNLISLWTHPRSHQHQHSHPLVSMGETDPGPPHIPNSAGCSSPLYKMAYSLHINYTPPPHTQNHL